MEKHPRFIYMRLPGFLELFSSYRDDKVGELGEHRHPRRHGRRRADFVFHLCGFRFSIFSLFSVAFIEFPGTLSVALQAGSKIETIGRNRKIYHSNALLSRPMKASS